MDLNPYSACFMFTKPRGQSLTLDKLSTHSFNPITGEVEAGGSEFQRHLQLHRSSRPTRATGDPVHTWVGGGRYFGGGTV